MRRLFFPLFVLLPVACFLLLLTSQAQAAGEFSTSHDIEYNVSENGETQVFDKISLVNLTTRYSASKLKLSLGKIKINGLIAKDARGPLDIAQKEDSGNSSVEVTFKDPVVGKDKTREFSISYKTSDLAAKVGQIWQLNIPKLGSSLDISQYNVSLKLPKSFGQLAYLKPLPKNQNEEGQTIIFNFDKDRLLASGISAGFGEKQLLKFELQYQLKNPSLTAKDFEIAIPPDTNYQQVLYQKIDPKPKNLKVDQDGNWLAVFRLGANQQLQFKVLGYAQLFPKLKFSQSNLEMFKPSDLYLSGDQFWTVDDSQIKKFAKDLKNPKAIYDFVATRPFENPNQSKEGATSIIGAKEALNNPQKATSAEFADLFVTLARASGIPARKIEGYIVSQNASSGFHSWAEYWDENIGWIQVDPVWGATSGGLDYFDTLDFGHFTLVKQGISSLRPQPPAFYQNESSPNNLKIELAKDLPPTNADLTVSFDLPKSSIFNLPLKGKVVIENIGNAAFYNQNLNLIVTGASLLAGQNTAISILPPLAKLEIPFTLKTQSYFTGQIYQIDANLAGKLYHYQGRVSPLLPLLTLIVVFFLLTCGIFIFFFLRKNFKKPKS